MAFASCAKEQSVKGRKQGAETYAGISIIMKAQDGTRAQTDATGTIAEGVISKIKVFIIDDATSEMQTKEFLFANFETDPANTGYLRASAAILTTAGTKTVYAVANPTVALNALLTSAAAVKSNVLALSEAGYFTPNGTFDGTPGTLTNLVMSGKSTSAAIDVQSADEALADPFTVDLTRNVAKVSVQLAAAVEQIGGTLSDMEFALAAKAQKSYLIKAANPALYVTPTTDPIPTSYFTDNFSSRTSLAYADVNANGTLINDAAAWFALEHKADVWYEGNSTKIVIKGVYVPTKVVATYAAGGAVTTGTITKGDSFYVKISTQEAWSVAAYEAAVTTLGELAAADFSEIYDGGVGYYQVNIIDGTTDRVRGVERNNIYELTVTSVTGPGDPTEDGGDDDDDENQEESYIAVSVKTIPWTYNTWSQGIQ